MQARTVAAMSSDIAASMTIQTTVTTSRRTPAFRPPAPRASAVIGAWAVSRFSPRRFEPWRNRHVHALCRESTIQDGALSGATYAAFPILGPRDTSLRQRVMFDREGQEVATSKLGLVLFLLSGLRHSLPHPAPRCRGVPGAHASLRVVAHVILYGCECGASTDRAHEAIEAQCAAARA